MIFLLLCPVAATTLYILRQDDVQFDGSRLGKPSIFSSYLWNPVISAMFAWLILVEYKRVSVVPVFWLIGLLGAAMFLFCTLRYIRECRGKVGVKIYLIFMAVAFGAQITSVLVLLSHLA